MATKISETHLSWLKAFGQDTYGINIPYSIAKTMEIKGLIEWVPPKFGACHWAITDKGRKVLRENSQSSALRQE